MKRVTIHVSISEELKKQLDEEAKELDLNLSAYIRMILKLRNQQAKIVNVK